MMNTQEITEHNARVFEAVVQDGKKYTLGLHPESKLMVAMTGVGIVDATACFHEAIRRGMYVELDWEGERGSIKFHLDPPRCSKCGQELP